MSNMIPIRLFLESRRSTKKEKEEYQDGVSLLDNILNDEKNVDVDEFVKDFIRPNGPTIYAFVTDKVKDAIKVGYTDQHPEKRIEQWREEYGKGQGEVECLGWWSAEEFNEAGERVFFWDHALHRKISDKGYKQLVNREDFLASLTDAGKKVVNIHFSREFFEKYRRLIDGRLDPEDKEELSAQLIEDIIKQMHENIKKGTADFKLYSFDKEGKTSTKEADKIWGSPDTYSNTKLQEEAIKNGIEAIREGKKNILMAAVMRFGKTHASYEIIKGAGMKRVVVCSAKADVRTAWRDDINHVDFYSDFVFVEVLDQYKWSITRLKGDRLATEQINVYEDTNIFDMYKDKTLIFFFTLHDLGGSVKAIKEKHKKIFGEEFDMMVVDETHYGSHASTFGKATGLAKDEISDDNSDVEEEQKLAKEVQDGLNSLNIKYKHILQVSGTPYYILASNEMISEDAAIISKVSYSDMLNARDEWNREHKGEDPSKSPYFGVPTLHKIGLRLTKECRKALAGSDVTTSLTELFKVKGGKFVYEDAVKSLMKSIFGDGRSNSLAFLKNKSVDGNKVCKHTLVVLPRIEACEVMKKLLEGIIDTNERKIFTISGNNRQFENVNVLNDKLEELDEKGKKSISLTVNRFLTGVSMPLIDSMIYLKNASSPQEYDQNIFRLCTRHVKTVKNPDSEFKSKKVNMKENVYLIDFNIANMFNMVANSAKMKAAADGNPTIERIRDYMKQDLAATPIFCEDGGSSEILGKMKKINDKDMMEIYTSYNKNKSISDIVNDEIDMFDKLFSEKKFQKVIEEIDVDRDKSKIVIGGNQEGTDELENIGSGSKKESDGIPHLKDYVNSKDDKKVAAMTKEKFKAITKNLLYCNICLDEPCKDVDEIVERSKSDQDFHKMLHEFKIKVGDLKKVYDAMGMNFKQAYNTLLMRMSILAQDTSERGYDKFSKALEGLGRLGKNEVVTPQVIVEKMIDKLTRSDYEKANSILIVNDKQAEFFIGIYKKFGKQVAKKCRIVASSEIGKHLCIKMLKSIGIDNYINNIIDIPDIDGNGYYDVNDFLAMDNKEILEKNGGKRFDCVLMNPPYNNGISNTFLYKILNIGNKVITIQPDSYLFKGKNGIEKIKNILNDGNTNIESIDANNFFDGAFQNRIAILTYINDNSKNVVYNDKHIDDLMKLDFRQGDDLIIEFKNIVKELYSSNNCGNKWKGVPGSHYPDKYVNNEDENSWIVQCVLLRGHVAPQQRDGKANDFYTLITNNDKLLEKQFIGKYKDLISIKDNKGKTKLQYYYKFNSEKEAHNFINYIKTDFARACLYLKKKDMNVNWECIPWFDFSDSHFSKSPHEIDDWLFEKYNISNDIRKHIEEILPDYYSIRDKK